MSIEISRRSFLKGSAAAAVSSLLLGSSGIAFAEDTKVEATPASTWRTAPDPIPESEIVETLEADVVVLGAGHAGSCCARAVTKGSAASITAINIRLSTNK